MNCLQIFRRKQRTFISSTSQIWEVFAPFAAFLKKTSNQCVNMWTIFIYAKSTINSKKKKRQVVKSVYFVIVPGCSTYYEPFCMFACIGGLVWSMCNVCACGSELYSHLPCCLAGWLAACHVLCSCVYVRAGVVENVNDVWAVSWAGRKLSGGVAWVTLLSINRSCTHGRQTDR